MLTLLLYVLIVGLVAALLFLVASAVFGRGEELGPLPEGTTVTVLPAHGISGSDVRALRFQQVVRGYKAGEVDWALTRLAARIDELETQLAQARAGAGSPEAAAFGAPAGNGTPHPAAVAATPHAAPAATEQVVGTAGHAVGIGHGTAVGHAAGVDQAVAGGVPAPRRVPAVLPAESNSETALDGSAESAGGNSGLSRESEGRGTAR
ncbi:DivIVA domain-containing protein [Nocardia acididurans]|uniref:DivIVA domain-containing protein n=1 Tax=Nocardia acididurans TaxID=2802282 RepID=UPI00355890AF